MMLDSAAIVLVTLAGWLVTFLAGRAIQHDMATGSELRKSLALLLLSLLIHGIAIYFAIT